MYNTLIWTRMTGRFYRQGHSVFILFSMRFISAKQQCADYDKSQSIRRLLSEKEKRNSKLAEKIEGWAGGLKNRQMANSDKHF